MQIVLQNIIKFVLHMCCAISVCGTIIVEYVEGVNAHFGTPVSYIQVLLIFLIPSDIKDDEG